MAIILGIDEAGRGPVIGPLVIAGVSIDEKGLDRLSELGVKDSKLLSPNQREGMFDKITSTAREYKVIIIPPKEIDSTLKSRSLNLNWLEAIKSAEIIDFLKPKKAIIDCPSSNIREIKKIQKSIKEPIGSGYPSDPITVNFLEKNYNKYQEIFRKEWASWKNINKKKKQKSLKDF